MTRPRRIHKSDPRVEFAHVPSLVIAVLLLAPFGGSGARVAAGLSTTPQVTFAPVDSNLARSDMILSLLGRSSSNAETLKNLASIVEVWDASLLATASAPARKTLAGNLDRASRLIRQIKRFDSVRASPADWLAGVAFREELAALGISPESSFARAGPTLPSLALAPLLKSRHVSLSTYQVGVIRRLDLLPRPLGIALASVVESFSTYLDATQQGLGSIDRKRLAEHLVWTDPLGSASPLGRVSDWVVSNRRSDLATVLRRVGISLESLVKARLSLLSASITLARVAAKVNGAFSEPDRLVIPGVLAIDMSSSDNVYSSDFALLVDRGGNDVYLNNGGGSGIGPRSCYLDRAPTAAALVDLGGNDRYEGRGRCGINGGAFIGSGFLYDASGADVYGPTSGEVNGGAVFGTALLYDGGGDDGYFGTGVAQGSGEFGSGLLVDVAGDDVYQGLSDTQNPDTGGSANAAARVGLGMLLDGGGDDFFGGVNGAAFAGIALMVDVEGEDTYDGTGGFGTAGGEGLLVDVEGDDRHTGSLIAAADEGGNGLLVDSDGDDEYVGTTLQGMTNGVASDGAIGMLLDLAGDDRYEARGSLANGSGKSGGLGFLLDKAGDDLFVGQDAANGSALAGGSGILVDGSGNDHHTVSGSIGNGSAELGAGFLVDAAGDDSYVVIGSLGNGAAACGSGFLHDASGDDSYLGGNHGANGGVVLCSEPFASGSLIDDQGDDEYIAGSVGVNGGAEFPAGPGLLLDLEGHDTYQDDDGGTGSDCSVPGKGGLGNQLDVPHAGCEHHSDVTPRSAYSRGPVR